MNILDTSKIKRFLDEKPNRREINIFFWSGGIKISIRQPSDKIDYQISWEELTFCKLDLLEKRISDMIKTLTQDSVG